MEEGWDEILQKYPPDVMILENEYPIIDMLNLTKDWNIVFAGPKFTVFVNDKIKKDKYIRPKESLEYYQKNLFDTKIDFRKKK